MIARNFSLEKYTATTRKIHSQKGTKYDLLDYQFAIHSGISIPQNK